MQIPVFGFSTGLSDLTEASLNQHALLLRRTTKPAPCSEWLYSTQRESDPHLLLAMLPGFIPGANFMLISNATLVWWMCRMMV